FDPRNLFSRRVLVCTAEGDLPGVMNPGGRPVHISSPDERKKVPEVKEFFVDVGLPAEEVRERVRVGDYVVMNEPLVEMGNKVVRRLYESGKGHRCEVYVAVTTQEEVGLRGARVAAFVVKPHIGLGIDVTLSCDTPGVPEEESVTTQGQGFGLHIKDSSFI